MTHTSDAGVSEGVERGKREKDTAMVGELGKVVAVLLGMDGLTTFVLSLTSGVYYTAKSSVFIGL